MPRTTTTSKRRSDASVLEIDGLLWKPRAGTRVSADEFAAARATMIEIHRDARWNPWVEQDRAAELELAMATFEQWTRAEPDRRVKTEVDIDAMLAEWEATWEAERKAQEAAQHGRKAQYDVDRESARLRLLELEAHTFIAALERDQLVSHERFPAMDDTRRAKAIAEEQARIDRATELIGALKPVVGDPETVSDVHGWLPSERRELSLSRFSSRRRREVERLRDEVATLPVTLKQAQGREPRAEIRQQLQRAERELAVWLAVEPLEAPDMCSECAQPMGWHLRNGYNLGEFAGPCAAWPSWRARLDKAREMILSWSATKNPLPPAPPKPQPIAVLKSGTPIEEVIARLTELSAQHPGAEVRRGNANRWEIWPATSAKRP